VGLVSNDPSPPPHDDRDLQP